MTYLVDTSVLSELRKRIPDAAVVRWEAAVPPAHLFTSVLVIGELRRGVAKLADRDRAQALQSWIELAVLRLYRDRVLPVDEAVAVAWGVMYGSAEHRGVTLPAFDSLIAATALVHGLTVVTRNTRDFERCGVPTLDPWHA